MNEVKFHYGTENDLTWSKDDPKTYISAHITDKSRVLDVGCGAGALGAWLKREKNCYVAGIEGHPDGARIAESRLDAVYKLDLNDLKSVEKAMAKQLFDAIVFVDVLEHCYYAVELLQLFQKNLAPQGKILYSVPNVAHHSVRFGLLKGNFDYTDTGILDKTHVKLYTRASAIKLAEQAGLTIEAVENTSPSNGLWGLVSKFDPTLSAVQFIIIAHA